MRSVIFFDYNPFPLVLGTPIQPEKKPIPIDPLKAPMPKARWEEGHAPLHVEITAQKTPKSVWKTGIPPALGMYYTICCNQNQTPEQQLEICKAPDGYVRCWKGENWWRQASAILLPESSLYRVYWKEIQ